MIRRRRFIQLAAAGLAMPLLSQAARAQAYPARPITLIVPYPPGGATDAIGRILQDAISRALGQQVIIENIGGAGGTIAAARAARADADGYTLLLHQIALAASVSLYKNLTYDAERDFAPIGLINTAASTWAARKDLPPKDFPEMVDWMRQSGRNAKVAHPGVGSYGHLAGVLVAQELGATVTQVPYRGAGPALNDLLGGQVDLSSQSAVQSTPLIKGGSIKAYAVIGRTRFSGLPDLPTMGELGYKKLDLDFWHMLLAPRATPRPIIERVNSALRTAMTDPNVKRTFADGGMDPFPESETSPEAAAAFLAREIKMWGDVIRSNNIAT